MKEIRFFYAPEADKTLELPVEEAKHAIRVLRMNAGDEMYLMDGRGTFYHAEVGMTTSKKCLYHINETLPQEKTWNGHIHLAIAPTKMIDRMEWMAEKATEVGLDELSFIDCKFSERQHIRVDRIEKIVVSAMKQSRKAWKPQVNDMLAFNEFIGSPRKGAKFIAHCYTEIERKDLFGELTELQGDEEVTIMVGPEGDFSVDEVKAAMDKGFVSVSLGNSRLRTETAGMMAVAMAQITKRK